MGDSLKKKCRKTASKRDKTAAGDLTVTSRGKKKKVKRGGGRRPRAGAGGCGLGF